MTLSVYELLTYGMCVYTLINAQMTSKYGKSKDVRYGIASNVTRVLS